MSPRARAQQAPLHPRAAPTRTCLALIVLLGSLAAQDDPAARLIELDAQRPKLRAELRHDELIAAYTSLVAATAPAHPDVHRLANTHLAALALEQSMLVQAGPLADLRALSLPDLLARLAATDFSAQDQITFALFAAFRGDRAVAETALARARERDASVKAATDQALASIRHEPIPTGGYHRYRDAFLPLAERDLAQALDDVFEALQASTRLTALRLPFAPATAASNLAAFRALREAGPAFLRDAAAQLSTALDVRYSIPRGWIGSYTRSSLRAPLLDADARLAAHAKDALALIATYDKPDQPKVDTFRTELTALRAQLDAAITADQISYRNASPADALRLRDEIRDLEEALRRIDAYFARAGLAPIGPVELRMPPDAPTSRTRILAGREHTGLEDSLWFVLHARTGLPNETIARADELLRFADRLTPWERVVVSDFRDAAIDAYLQEVAATSMDDAERQFVEHLNRYRRILRLRPVEVDERLVRSSRKHSEEMVKLGYFGHVSPVPERRSPSDRARLEGYGSGVGENCLAGTVDGAGAFEGWYRSPGHHRNMIGAGPTLGVGATPDHGMWTMVIGGGDDSWRLAHRDATPARRAELTAEITRTLAELRRPRREATPPRGAGDEVLPLLLRAAFPLPYSARTAADRALAVELFRLAVATPALPEQRVLLEVAATTAKERLGLELPLPAAAVATVTPPQPPLRVPARADGPSLKAPLKLLTKSERLRLSRQFGGGPQTERAVERGLAFLARAQDVDGAWRARSFPSLLPEGEKARNAMVGNAEHEIAMTGLSLLAFVATGSSPEQGEHAAVVAKGTRFLMGRLLDFGRFETGASHYMYSHAIATQALCEVYAYTANPTIGVYAQLALDYLLRAQHRPSGGWRYEPDQHGDTSVVGWCVMALNSAYKAQLDVAGFRDALRFLDSVTENQYYRVGYLNPTDNGIFGNRLAAVAIVSRRFLGQDPKDARLYWPVVRMQEDLPDPANPDYYYWYYGTLGMFQAGGQAWKAWSDKIAPALLALHEESDRSPFDGSWRNDRHHSGTGGRIYNTAVAILTLTTYYRYDRAPKTKLAPFTGDIDKAIAPYLAVLRQEKPDDGLLAITEAKVIDTFGAYLVPPLLRELAQPHPEKVRRRLAALIEQGADERSEAALLANLTVSDDGEVRKMLVRTLERVCTAKSVPALLAAMQRDKHGHVRGHAARALGGLGGDDVVPALTARLTVESDNWAKGQIQEALRRLQTTSALDTLVDAALTDDRARTAARAGLSILVRDQLADRIAGLAGSDTKLHKKVLEAVRAFGEGAAIPVLITLLEADDEGLRTSAIGLLEALTRERNGFDPKQDAAARRETVRRWYSWWEERQHRFGVPKKK